MYLPQTPYTQIALDSILNNLDVKKGSTDRTQVSIPEEFYTIQRACFVSLHNLDGELRGCIGTLYPQEKSLYFEIERNAVSAAFRDMRFTPLSLDEINDIEISVDVLTTPETITSADDLDPQIYGIIVSDDKHNRGVLLPGIEGITTVEQQINIVKRKAGICMQTPFEELEILRFTSNRYR